VEISIEEIIRLVVREVVSELEKRGVHVTNSPNVNSENLVSSASHGLTNKSQKIDMSSYKSPVLTERHIRKLNELVGEIIVPHGTVITPKAREEIKKRRLILKFE
jgi:hypothetical protein